MFIVILEFFKVFDLILNSFRKSWKIFLIYFICGIFQDVVIFIMFLDWE